MYVCMYACMRRHCSKNVTHHFVCKMSAVVDICSLLIMYVYMMLYMYIISFFTHILDVKDHNIKTAKHNLSIIVQPMQEQLVSSLPLSVLAL